nr:hypothetical protein [Tanacetum cinerariifolium]
MHDISAIRVSTCPAHASNASTSLHKAPNVMGVLSSSCSRILSWAPNSVKNPPASAVAGEAIVDGTVSDILGDEIGEGTIEEVAAMSDSAFLRDEEEYEEKEEDKEVEESLDSDSESEDAEDEGPTAGNEGPTAGDEGPTTEDEGPAMGDEGPSIRVERLGLGGDKAVLEGQQVFDLEKIKTAQEKEIVDLKKRVKKLERKRRSKTSRMNLFKIGTSRRRSLGEEDASKQGRNLKQRSIFKESDFDVQVMMDADYELAARLRAEEKRRKPLTKAQKKNQI